MDDREKEKGSDQEILGTEVKALMNNAIQTIFDDPERDYNHEESDIWMKRLCEYLLTELQKPKKAYKYVVGCTIARKMGAGLHVCTSCYYGPQDGSLTEGFEATKNIFAILSVYWTAI
eukprot:GILI01015603.1.p1 GENE.GILI01015603.1~~GILI01015603.1.p1  ORF type:complete len:118 (+),score=18.94 GILI01015603.1:78-431(+)